MLLPKQISENFTKNFVMGVVMGRPLRKMPILHLLTAVATLPTIVNEVLRLLIILRPWNPCHLFRAVTPSLKYPNVTEDVKFFTPSTLEARNGKEK
jgi:hypothetical protein